jgi:hypothetical protein
VLREYQGHYNHHRPHLCAPGVVRPAPGRSRASRRAVCQEPDVSRRVVRASPGCTRGRGLP